MNANLKPQKPSIEELKTALSEYNKAIENVRKDIDEVENFKADILERYDKNIDTDDVLKRQAAVIRYSDYIAAKREQLVELKRQRRELDQGAADRLWQHGQRVVHPGKHRLVGRVGRRHRRENGNRPGYNRRFTIAHKKNET